MAEVKTHYSFAVRRRVFEEYLEDVPHNEISARNDVPISTIKQWVTSKGWKAKKDELQANSIKDIEDKYKNVIHKNQLQILDRKLRNAALIDRAIRERLINPDGTFRKLTDEQLKNVADAFQKNANVDAKIVGLLTPQNQMSIMVGSGGMINIGVQGSPAKQIEPTHHETHIQGTVDEPVYKRKLVDDTNPF